jgi:hypothetical protein
MGAANTTINCKPQKYLSFHCIRKNNYDDLKVGSM